MKINSEMNLKYNTYDHLDKMQCIEDEYILNLEKKFDPFLIDKNYNYAINIVKVKNSLPLINIDLSKIIEYYKKSDNLSVDALIKEIASINNYFELLTKYITLNKIESIKEKSIIYYLFSYMSQAFFYIIMNNSFMVSKDNCKEYTKFFTNYENVIKTAKLYLKDSISKSSMIIEEDSSNKIKKKKKDIGTYEAFEQIKKYPNEFKEAILNCQNFLILVLFSADEKKNNLLFPQSNVIDRDMSALLEIFVMNMNLLYEVNKYYSIIDYKNFYNDGISRKISLKVEFHNYINNEKIRRKIRREKQNTSNRGKK